MASPGLYLNEKKTRPIEAHRPALSKQELESVLNCLIEDRLGQGDVTRRFERNFANAFGYKHALALNSLASAYHLAFLALDLQADDVTLMSALAPIQAHDGVRYAGGRVALIDVARGSFFPDAEKLLARVDELLAEQTPAADGTNEAGKRQIFFVLDHAFGAASNVPVAALQARGVRIVEDFTGLVGSDQNGEFFGKSGEISVCGMSEYDLLTVGNGAIAITQDPRLYKKMHALRYGGKRAEGSVAYDYRLGDFQAAMGVDQLSRLGVTLARRKKIGQKYLETLRTTNHESYFRTPGVDAYLRFPVIVNKSHDEVLRYFASLQIGVDRAVETPLHHLLGFPRLEFPNAERIYQKSVAIPLYPPLTANNVERIASSLRGLI